MMKRSVVSILALAFCLSSPVGALTIEWVSEYTDVDANGVIPDDIGWINLLQSQGYTVNVRADSTNSIYWTTLDDTKIGYLNAADLVIFSRLTNSGSYDDGTEPTQFNAVTKPMITLSAAICMSNRWRILNNSTQTNLAAPTMQVLDPSHPIFAGITLDSNNQVQVIDAAVGYRAGGSGNNGATTVLAAISAGNGTLLATVAGANAYVWIAEWTQNTTPYYEGGPQAPGGNRLTFFAGTQNNASPGTGLSAIGQGLYNLNAEGEKMFLNAVNYMIPEPATITILSLGGLALVRNRRKA